MEVVGCLEREAYVESCVLGNEQIWDSGAPRDWSWKMEKSSKGRRFDESCPIIMAFQRLRVVVHQVDGKQ